MKCPPSARVNHFSMRGKPGPAPKTTGGFRIHTGVNSQPEVNIILTLNLCVGFTLCWRVGFLVCCFPPCAVSPLRCLAGALCGSG